MLLSRVLYRARCCEDGPALPSGGALPPKWERKDYRDRTIAKAIAGCTEVYTPARQAGSDNGRSPEVAAVAATPTAPAPLPSPDPLSDMANGARLVAQAWPRPSLLPHATEVDCL